MSIEQAIRDAVGLAQAGRMGDAVAGLSAALTAAPDHPGGNGLMGTLLHAMGRTAEAIPHLERAYAAAPAEPRLAYQLGALLFASGQTQRGLAAMARAIELQPDWLQGLNGFASALTTAGDFDRAEATYKRSLAVKPDQPEAACGLAGMKIVGGAVREAVELFREAGRRWPDSADVRGKLLSALNYAEDATPQESLAAHRHWGELAMGAAQPPPAFTNPRDPERRLRIGLLSPDLYDHSCAYFLRPLLAHRDRERYEVVCYSWAGRSDWMTEQLRSGADVWRDVAGLAEQRLVETIRADGVDVLIELSGHTAMGPLAALRHRAAPVQATYLGYPNTTGLPTIDYRIVDAATDPPDADSWHTEKLVRLDGCFLCYSPSEFAPPVAPPPSAANGFITFGSFNSIRKINPTVIAAWAAAMLATPGSRLLLKTRGLGLPYTRRNMEAEFARHGVGPERLELHDMVPSKPDHLGWYSRIDISLDTFPYNGTTTTCEALWMGVPVVTVAGGVHAGRVGMSLLKAAGLPELVAPDPIAFSVIAAGLAGEPDRLAAMRAEMRDRLRGSVLLDGSGHAGRFYGGVRGMWRSWCAG